MSELIEPSPPRRRLLSLAGRTNRSQYIIRTLGAAVIAFIVIFLLSLVLSHMGEMGRLIYVIVSVLIFYVILPLYVAVQTVRRSHDFNFSGLILVLLLVPIVNLLFWFYPGSRGENKYGPPPPAPSLLEKILACALPVLLIVTFLFTAAGDNPHPESQPALLLKPYTP